MKFILRHQNQIASIIPSRNIIFIGRQFNALKNYNMRVFILLHELAHYFTPNQFEADRIAVETYYKRGYPLRDAIYAITTCIRNMHGLERARRLYEYIRLHFKVI